MHNDEVQSDLQYCYNLQVLSVPTLVSLKLGNLKPYHQGKTGQLFCYWDKLTNQSANK
jgi:hypothetical protein